MGREGEIGREGERVSQTPFVWLTVLTYMLTNIVNCGKQEKSEILWRRKKRKYIFKKKKMGGKWKFRKIVYNGMYVRKFQGVGIPTPWEIYTKIGVRVTVYKQLYIPVLLFSRSLKIGVKFALKSQLLNLAGELDVYSPQLQFLCEN